MGSTARAPFAVSAATVAAMSRTRRETCAGGAVRVSVLVHQLVDVGNLLEGERLRQARVDLPGRDEVVQRARLVVVREMRTLETLLAHPQVAEIGDRVVARRSGADDDHAPGVA